MTVRVRGGRLMIDISHKLGGGRVDRIRVAVPKHITSRRAAEAYERTVLADLRAGIDPRAAAPRPEPERAPTVADYAATYLRQQTRDAGLKASTHQSKKRLLDKWIVPVVGGRPVDAVRTADFTAIRSAMSDAEREPKTINNALAVLSSLVKFWHEQHDRPVPHFKTGRVKMERRGRRPKFYTDAEVERLIAAADTRPDVLALVLFGVDAGLRMSECRALQWSDLQLEGRPMVVVSRTREDGEGGGVDDEPPPKGWTSRAVKLTPRLVAALAALPRHIRDPHLFLDRWGQPLTRRMVARRFEAAQRGAGIDHGTYHWTRHTFCTRLAMQGTAARTIQELAGHADLSTTQQYMWCHPEAGDAAIDRLSAPAKARSGHSPGRRRKNAS